MSLLKKRILGAKTLKAKKVDLPDWPDLDGVVWVRKLTPRQMMEAVKRYGPLKEGEERDVAAFFPDMVTYFVCDEDNALLFGADDIDVLSNTMSVDALQAIVAAGMEYNGMSVEGQEDLRKNLPATPTSDSPTD